METEMEVLEWHVLAVFVNLTVVLVISFAGLVFHIVSKHEDKKNT